jgi:hypothetical protein
MTSNPETRIGVEAPIERLLNDYEAQCAQCREPVAMHDLDWPSEQTISTGAPVTLRWIPFQISGALPAGSRRCRSRPVPV